MVTIFLEGDVKFTVNQEVHKIEVAIDIARENKEFLFIRAETHETGNNFPVWINPDKIIFMR